MLPLKARNLSGSIARYAEPMDSEIEQRKERERVRALEWLESKWTTPKLCPICSTNQWTVTELIEARSFEGGNLIIGGGSGLFVFFQVICTNCGFTHLFNANLAGIVEPLSGQPDE